MIQCGRMINTIRNSSLSKLKITIELFSFLSHLCEFFAIKIETQKVMTFSPALIID